VADGTRTHDHRDHNPGLYQLSYRHLELTQNSPMPPLSKQDARLALVPVSPRCGDDDEA
jgi:hypothetical protein